MALGKGLGERVRDDWLAVERVKGGGWRRLEFDGDKEEQQPR